VANKTITLNNYDLESLRQHLATLPPEHRAVTSWVARVEAQIAKAQKPPPNPKSAKGKGLEFQRSIARDVAELIGCTYGSDDEAEVFSRPSGHNGVDIGLRGMARHRFPFAVECKAGRSFSLKNAMQQATANANKGSRDEMPLAVHRPHNSAQSYAVLTWRDFLFIAGQFLQHIGRFKVGEDGRVYNG